MIDDDGNNNNDDEIMKMMKKQPCTAFRCTFALSIQNINSCLVF